MLAGDLRLREEVKSLASEPIADRELLWQHLDRIKRENEERISSLTRVSDASWFLLDSKGFQRWRSPAEPTLLDTNVAWRDFFHGQGTDYPVDRVPDDIHAIRSCRISIPYKSSVNELYVVALSVPIFDHKEGEEVIGVLCRTLTLGNLIKDYQSAWQKKEADGVNRQLAIIDGSERNGKHSWQLLAHSWMDDSKLEKFPLEDFRKLKLEGIVDPEVIRDLEHLMEQTKRGNASEVPDGEFDRTVHYIDPVRQFEPVTYGGEWLAAFSPVGATKWIAVVQERKDAALLPVEQLQNRMLTSAKGGVLVVFALVAGSWWLIVALLNERAPRWLRFWQSRSASQGAATVSLTGKGAESG